MLIYFRDMQVNKGLNPVIVILLDFLRVIKFFKPAQCFKEFRIVQQVKMGA
jgi:hypothetical protein